MPRAYKRASHTRAPADTNAPTDTATPADFIPFAPGKERKTKEPATNTSTLTNIKSNLDLAWVKIQNALQQETEGHKLWTEGTLELINILDDARKRLGSDQAFGTWLSENGYGANRITRHDRSALLNMALDLHVTREVLEQTHRRSWRLIWEEEMQPRLPSAGQPTDGTRRPKKKGKGAKKEANGEQKPEWLRDTKGWFNNQVERVNAVIDELNKIMENCTPEQHNLLTDLEPTLLFEAFQKGEKTSATFVTWVETPLEIAADKLIGEGRVRITPAPTPVRRAEHDAVQPGA